MHLCLGLVRLPQFFLDGLELLAEEVLALRLVHLRLYLGLNLGTQLQHFQLSIHNLREVAQSSRHINLFQELLLLFRSYAHRGGDEEAERTRVLNVQRRHLQLFRKVRDELHYAAVDGGQIALECLQLFSFFREVIQITDLSAQERLFFQVVIYSNPADTLDQDAKCAVRRLHHLLHQRESTDIVGIIWAGQFHLRVLHRHKAHQLVSRQDMVYQLDRACLSHGQRHNGLREDDSVSQRQYGYALGGNG